jgi:hypothetical protein
MVIDDVIHRMISELSQCELRSGPTGALSSTKRYDKGCCMNPQV